MDKIKFLSTFKSEADDLVVRLQNGFIELEKNPVNYELINELNRYAHTIKGAARMMGFNDIQDVAHEIEDTFAAIGRNEYPYTKEIGDNVFQKLDKIKELVVKAVKEAQEQANTPKAENSAAFHGEPIPQVQQVSIVEEFIKVPIKRIDEIINLVGEIITNKGNAEVSVPLVAEMQNKAREMRMLPASTIFENYPRLIRDIATAQNKNVELIIEGGDTEVDKKILEEINPAIIHMLRNAVDHGISENGVVTVSARHESGSILIEVEDNGQGIDVGKIKEVALKKKLISQAELAKKTDNEIINFIFTPGFSTSPIISDVSGRGVGMDVVKTQTDKVRGQVKIETSKGCGTKIILKLPLTVAIIRSIFVKAANIMFAIPLLSIDETLEVEQSGINSIEGNLAFNLRGHTLPLVDLGRLLGLPNQNNIDHGDLSKKIQIVTISSLEKKLGLVVDHIINEEEIYIKPIGDYLGQIKNIEGAAIVGTGDVVIVLDAPDLIETASLKFAVVEKETAVQPKEEAKRILVVEDSFTTRELEKSILEAQGYIVETAVDGLDAIDILTRFIPNLIVTDLQMPRMDGFEMCLAIKKNDKLKAIPVVMVTALEREEDKRHGIEVGADAYITKGTFEQKNLLETIERLI